MHARRDTFALLIRFGCIALAALPMAAWRPALAAVSDDVGKVFLKQPVFRIPVEISKDKIPLIQELRLYVSTDRGRTWDMVKVAKPTQEHFTFRAQSDGEYWFTLAHVDQQGRVEPADVTKEPAGLRVVLDTKSPTISMRSRPRSNGKASVTWKVEDEWLDLSSFQIEVRKDGDSNWQPVSVSRVAEGEAEWSANAADGFAVRASVRDRADNVGTAQIDVTAEPTQRGPIADATKVAPPPPVEMPPRPATRSRWDEGTQTPPRTLDLTDRTFAETANGTSADAEPTVERTNPTTETRYKPASNRYASTAFRTGLPRRNQEPDAAPVPAATPLFDRSRPDLPARPAVSGSEDARPSPQMWASRIPVASTQGNVAPTAAVVEPEPKPMTRKIPLVNSTRFAVDYELRGVGPAGVGKVQLFHTADNGQTWTLYGEDADRMPPFEVELPGEGRYGIRVHVTSPAGYGQKPPVAGEQPQTLVEVDMTPPEAELYQPIPDPASPSDSLLISWSGRDAHLGADPVALYFAEHAEGPWYQVKIGLPATGQYSWRVPGNIPYQVYLRLMTTDMVGNISVADTPEPIVVDFSRPEAEVINIVALPDRGPKR